MSATSEKIVAITGASAGIGAALAEEVARRGHTPVLIARRKDALEAVAARCGGQALVIPADATVRDQVREAVGTAVRRFGRLDVWVNNAGQGISRVPTLLTEDDVDEMIRVNVKSVLIGTQEAVGRFKVQGSGQVINVSSMLGRLPLATFRAAYTGAKHYVNALTAEFRNELAKDYPGIAISLVSPGVVRTDFGLNAVHGGVDSKTLPGSQGAEEVAAVIADVIGSRRADVYTRVGARQMVLDYYASHGEDP